MPLLNRYLLIALMLVLLPLRGWAGNVMAVDMAATAVVKASMANTSSQAPMSADCSMHMQTPDAETVSSCSNCDTCELCLAVANLSPALLQFNRLVPHPSPPAFSSGFTSAASASNFKPPII